MYQNIVNQDPTERSHAHWDDVQELEAVLRGKCTSSPTSFSRSIFFPNLPSSSVNSAKCDSTRQRSGGFYVPNEQLLDDPIIISEECVDLDRYLNAASSDERSAAEVVDSASAAAIHNKEKAIVADTKANDLGHNLFNNTISSNYLRYADPPMNPLVTINNLKDIDKNGNNIKNTNSNEEYMTMDVIDNNSNIHSGYTSACTSPSNVLSMEGSPSDEYFLLNGAEVSTDYAFNDGFLETLNSFMKEEERLPMVYTPDNSNEPYNGDFPSFKNNNNINTNNNNDNTKRNFPQLTLNLKDNFYSNEEINTPNIIDTIIASEHPIPYSISVKDEILKEPLFFTNTKLEELTPCPSTSPPPVASDNTDSFLTTTTDSPPAIVTKKRGRPPKRRRISEDSVDFDDLNDETYVPRSSQTVRRKPRTPRAVAAKQIIYEDVSDDDDYKPPSKLAITSEEVAKRLTSLYDATSDEVIRVGKRGRPPKHARSISSDDYSQLDPDEAKYREMRDRNNEASRKSRYKRKHKELLLSDECQELEMDNIKLKAQVEELQKTVERYRDNLMQVMLNKK